MSPNHQHPESFGGLNWSRINQWLLWLGLAAAVAWLFFGHSAHLLQIAPFLILLACPLMHVFGHGGGHGGHGHGHGQHGGDDSSTDRKPTTGSNTDGAKHVR
ncbi:DUF2933 domain-containing protein [Variovorax sp. JS1663]|uniref:DUF2933 domain-containing protein n=1 Tax=Variovorax sp. JS1663 TaxID=1851577 RepID=UPI000B348587|nr:DUF2933 domain-containing protein [Variovorax sp. JS1663]OUM00436.1 hypothetical protein A8M77_21545 [Variovorax sp. JS1663]